MLLWINGPFGGGKTATACELNRRLPGSVVCDPEHVGFGMHRMLPAALRTNWWDGSAADVALRYKELWAVEDAFRSMKSALETRPRFCQVF